MQEQVAVVKQGMLSVAGLKADVLSALCEQAKSGPGDVCQIATVPLHRVTGSAVTKDDI